MQVLADDLDVRALARQHFLGVLGDLVAVGIVLVQQVDLLDVRLVLHEGGQRLHLHRGVGVEAEVPVAALAVGQVGIDGRVVQVDDFLAGVALVVFADRVAQRQRDAGTIALHHVADALVGGGLQQVQRLGGAELVVEGDELELHAGRVALVELLDQELEGLDLVLADRAHQAGERVDIGQLDRLALLRLSATEAQRKGRRDAQRSEREAHRSDLEHACLLLWL
mmetsp:Transcript_57664/g.135770  ORF Transcript_57664/g.135770 Transcript_57664/m.135770 type:complete len:224 (+) Transcript_57664:1018-1689(+)